MATIECCETLSAATKAKLQDAGISYLSDLTHLIVSREATYADPQTSEKLDYLKQKLLERVITLTHSGNAASVSVSGVSADAQNRTTILDPLAPTPIESLAFFNDGEVAEIFDTLKERSDSGLPDAFESSNANLAVAPCSIKSPPLTSLSDAKPPKVNVETKKTPHIPGCRSLRDIYADVQRKQRHGYATHATTFSKALDTLLGGGVPVGGVTEVSGPPGVGKTQLLMQLAVSCAMPVEFGGLGGTCIFVDTEGSFVAERLEQMATAAVALVATILAKNALPHCGAQSTEGTTTLGAPLEVRSNQRQQESSDAFTRKRGRTPSPQPISNKHAREPSTSTVLNDEDNQPPIGANLTEEATAAKEKYEPSVKKCTMSRSTFSVESVLRRVQYVRITELTDFLAFLYSLPVWLDRRNINYSEKDKCASASSLPATSKHQNSPSSTATAEAVRMLIVDSIALPFRASDSFERNASLFDDVYGGSSHTFSTSKSTSAGALSKQRLWQRSRLLYQCSTTLGQIAAASQLAVVVSNHMTTKWLRTLAPSGVNDTSYGLHESDKHIPTNRQSVLIPALGDAWGHGLSTRVMLTFHHYELPSCAFATTGTAPPCNDERQSVEDVVYATTNAAATPEGPALLSRIVQHRVVRLLKASGQPRAETCFFITSKGIRDSRKDVVKHWLGQ